MQLHPFLPCPCRDLGQLPSDLFVFACTCRYSREEVLGFNCRFLQGPETSRSAIATLKKAVSQQEKCTVQLLNYRKDGEMSYELLLLVAFALTLSLPDLPQAAPSGTC